jgi:hypothetical protein
MNPPLIRGISLCGLGSVIVPFRGQAAVIRKNLIRHRQTRKSIRDAVRQELNWLARRTIPPTMALQRYRVLSMEAVSLNSEPYRYLT